MYRTRVPAHRFKTTKIALSATLHDYGVVLVNGNYAATMYRNNAPTTTLHVPHRWLRYPAADIRSYDDSYAPLHDEALHSIDWEKDEAEIDIIVENMGRDNFCKTADNKGIIGDVVLGGARHSLSLGIDYCCARVCAWYTLLCGINYCGCTCAVCVVLGGVLRTLSLGIKYCCCTCTVGIDTVVLGDVRCTLSLGTNYCCRTCAVGKGTVFRCRCNFFT